MKKTKRKAGFWGSAAGATVLLCLFLLQNLFGGPADGTAETAAATALPEGQLLVEYLDVGQADAILVRSGERVMLIDAGNNADGPPVADYLKEQGISSIDVLIGTHPHEDHIGGMDDIIRAFEIETFILPEVITTTKTFTSVLDAAEEKNLEITVAERGMRWNLGDAGCEILSCDAIHEAELNEWSVVVKMVFGDVSFLFTGDMEAANERFLLEQNVPLSVDILKSPHHGSDTSSTAAFVQAAAPKTVVISVGSENDYGHPDSRVLARYEKIGAEIFRTDRQGTVIVESNGKSYTVRQKNTNTNG